MRGLLNEKMTEEQSTLSKEKRKQGLYFMKW